MGESGYQEAYRHILEKLRQAQAKHGGTAIDGRLYGPAHDRMNASDINYLIERVEELKSRSKVTSATGLSPKSVGDQISKDFLRLTSVIDEIITKCVCHSHVPCNCDCDCRCGHCW